MSSPELRPNPPLRVILTIAATGILLSACCWHRSQTCHLSLLLHEPVLGTRTLFPRPFHIRAALAPDSSVSCSAWERWGERQNALWADSVCASDAPEPWGREGPAPPAFCPQLLLPWLCLPVAKTDQKSRVREPRRSPPGRGFPPRPEPDVDRDPVV